MIYALYRQFINLPVKSNPRNHMRKVLQGMLGSSVSVYTKEKIGRELYNAEQGVWTTQEDRGEGD